MGSFQKTRKMHLLGLIMYQYFDLMHSSIYDSRPKLCLKKTIHLTFDHYCGKCKPIFKILSLLDSHKTL